MAQPPILAGMTVSGMGFIVGLILLLVVGLILIIRGFRGKRVGNEPRCHRCAYNLTGLTSNRCPECGADLEVPHATMIGLRRRRNAALIVGLFMVGLAAGGWGARFYARAKKIDPYPLYPARWLVGMANSADPRALTELSTRYKAGKLSNGTIADCIAVGLAIQAAEERHLLITPWMTLLYQMIGDRHLTEDQEDTFYHQLARYNIKARSPIRAGEPFVLYTASDFRCPDPKSPNIRFPAYVFGRAVTAGEHVILKRSAFVRSNVTIEAYTGSSTWPIENVTQEIPPGRYEVVNSGTLKVYAPYVDRQFRNVDPDAEEPLAVTEIRSICEVEILPADSEELVKLIDRPDLKDSLFDVIEVESVSLRRPKWQADKNKVELNINVNLGRGQDLPIGVAFDVTVRIGDDEHRLAGINCRKGKRMSWGTGGSMPAFDDETVTIILRSSRDVAKRSLDLYEIWEGELVYEGVAVERPAGQ